MAAQARQASFKAVSLIHSEMTDSSKKTKNPARVGQDEARADRGDQETQRFGNEGGYDV
jgi:hypothetical protein